MFAARLAFVVVFEVGTSVNKIDMCSLTPLYNQRIISLIFVTTITTFNQPKLLLSQHVVFVLTGIMQFIIPDIPVELKTQIQREQLLAKEAKYQHGLKKSQENEYNELLQLLRDQNNTSRGGQVAVGGVRGSWARRLSRISDGLDAHVEISTKPKRSVESTVWEVT